MYEELIERLREYPDREETAGGYVEVDWQDLLDAADALEALTAQLAALQSENTELRSALSRVEAERDTYRTLDPIEELTALAKARDEGRVVVLPCKVGDTVFVTTQVFNGKDTVWMIGSRKIDKIEGNALNPIWMTSTEPYEMRFHPSEFSKTVFLTRAEAEAAISGQEGDAHETDPV